MTISKPLGPFRLVTVNTAPERAKRLIGRVVEDLKESYTIIHAGNADSMQAVRGIIQKEKPELLFTASMWTPEQAQSIIAEAKSIVPNIKTHSIPQGLQVEKGPDAVVEYLKDNIPLLLEHTRSKL
ncbi:hypothetical protein BT63DRAFT_429686 [Microthyrium microscopicum]|uniref:Uncharacterized protein n=1 Tax=Microthyrium microscopicum TaxID=703497 RepID=A0A6A6TVN9_9PEZI|nr:hypothetical protein BT63DRAFT_429686 [Microthyrium microscopicum]